MIGIVRSYSGQDVIYDFLAVGNVIWDLCSLSQAVGVRVLVGKLLNLPTRLLARDNPRKLGSPSSLLRKHEA